MVDDQSDSREKHLRDDPLLSKIPEVEGYKVLEPCVLYAKVGEGGMGAVYRGRHLNLDIDVAIKCLKNVLAEQSPAFVTRFQREARIAASVHHQNLVQVYDISEKNGVHYLVMEYVRGETARERVARKKRLKESEALKILLGAASGLAEAHGKKIVHRDIKPDNILISYDGAVKVSDLGLAKALEVDAGPSLTMGVMGTPQYMAPEQWEDSATVGPQADVWALGATFYYLLTGDHAVPAGSMQQIYRRICVDAFPDVQEKVPAISAQSKAILERCVQKDPKLRYPDCRELLRELSKIVIKDSGGSNLSDTESGTTRVPPLLSPPPAETMGHIRVALQDVGTKTLHVRTPTPADRATPYKAENPQPVPAAPPGSPVSVPASKRSRTPLLALSLSVPLLVLAWFLIERMGPEGGEPLVHAEDKGTQQAEQAASADDSGEEDGSDGKLEQGNTGKPGGDERGGTDPTVVAIGPESTGGTHEETKPAETKAAVVVLPPVLELDHSAAEGPIFTQQAGVQILGKVGHRPSGEVSLLDEHGNELQRAALVDGKFELLVPELEEGDHTLAVVFEDVRETVRVVWDQTLPKVQDPELPAIIGEHTYELRLGVEDEHLKEVWIETAAGPLPAERREGDELWSVQLALTEGSNAFTAVATDEAGNRGELQLSLLTDVTAPSRPEVAPAESERLIPGTAEFSLLFSEPGLTVQLDGFEPQSTGPDGKVELSALISAGMERYPLKGKVSDAAGNELPLDFSWGVMKEPKHPDGWVIDDSAGQDADYCAKRVQDPKTLIWFVLLPHGEGTKFFMAETEVTRQQWIQGSNSVKGLQPLGSEAPDDFPVTRVSWREADKFCLAFGYELPTPEVWRTACLGGATGAYSCSLKELPTQAWFAQPSATAVRKLKPNGFGLFDMHGNVWEWCSEENQALGGSHYGREGDLAVNRAPRTSGATADIGFRPVFREQTPSQSNESPR